ncbi:MAG: type 4a pilus biogenesis protein PilO [Patescibacteria group bacterium]
MPFREKILIFVSTLIICIFALIIFVIFPLINQVTGVKNEIDEQKITLEIMKNKSENISKIQKDYEIILEKKNDLEKMTLSSANQLNFFKNIEDLAQQNSLIQNYNLEAPSPNNTAETKINIQLNGDYLRILSYLKGLESLDYYIKIISINFSVSTAGAMVNATLQAKTYWQ